MSTAARRVSRSPDSPVVVHAEGATERGEAGVVRAVNEDLHRVPVTLLSFVDELACEVAQQRAHAQSPHFLGAVCWILSVSPLV